MVQVAWAAKVSNTFLDRVKWIVEDLVIGSSTADGMSNLMTCIAWESGVTFSPSVTNKAGSGATGLIQFMPSTAEQLGTTCEALAKMTAEDQLNYVWKYFQSYKGKLVTLSDLYMAILWPKAIGKPETYVLWDKASMPTTFRQNSGLDINKDGGIVKAEATAKLTATLAEGMKPGNSKEYSSPNTLFDGVAIFSKTADKVVDLATEAVELAPVKVPVAITSAVEAAKTVTETADAITTVVVEPKDTATVVKHAISGWQGNLAGTVAIVGGLMLDPNFSALLGKFTVALASGSGRWGALAALLGAGLVAYRHKPSPPG